MESVPTDVLDSFEDDEAHGLGVVVMSIKVPLLQIVENAGGDSLSVLASVMSEGDGYGYNAKTEEYGDLFEMGVIDPAKVTRVALQNAVSVAGMILITECVVANPEATQSQFMYGNG